MRNSLSGALRTLFGRRGTGGGEGTGGDIFRVVMETSPDAILLTSPDGTIRKANEKAAELFGFDEADDLIGRNAVDFLRSEDRDNLRLALTRLSRTWGIRDEEKMLHTHYLSFFWGELNISAVEGGALWMVKDVTGRRRAEESARESGRRYLSLFEESRDAIFLSSRQGKFMDVNQATLDLFGYARAEMVGSSALDLVWLNAEDRRRFVDEIEKRGFVRDFETRLRRKDGAVLECLLTATLWRAGDGKVIGYQGIARDVTERNRAMEALRALEEQESSILQAIPHAVIGLQNRRIIFVNDAVRGVFGWEPSELIGKTTRILYRSDADYEKIAERFYPRLERRRTHTEDFLCRRKDGSDIVCRISASRIGESLVDRKIVVMYEDITASVRADRALEEQKRFTEKLIQNFEVPAFVIDRNHAVMLWNTACESLTGVPARDVIGTRDQWKAFYTDIRPTLADIVIDRRFDELPALYENYSKSKFIDDSWHAEGWYADIGGSERYMMFDAVPIHSDGGEITAAIETLQDITVLKKTEEALRASENRYRAIFENTGTATIIIEEDTTISLVNTEFEKLSGYSRSEVEGRRSWTEFVAEEDLSRMKAYHDSRRENPGRAPKNYEFTFTTRDRGERRIYLTVAMIPGTRQSVASILDVTDREKAENLLRESESRFRALAETTPAAIFVYRRKFLYVNPASTQLTGYTADELLDLDFHEMVHPDDREMVLQRGLARQRGEDVPSHYEFKIVRKDGQERWVDFAGTLIMFQGQPAGLGTAFDITGRIRAGEETARMRHYLQNVIDSMPSVVVGVDTGGTITHWNMQAARVTGVTQEEARGSAFAKLLPGLEDQLDKVGRAIREMKVQKTERMARLTGGELRYSDVLVYPLIGDGVQGAVIRVDDVTERVRIEEMMIQTEKMMSVGGLAAGMAHEINNPLGGILMGAENVLRRISPDLPRNAEAARECGMDLDALNRYMEKRGILRMLEGIREMGDRASKIVVNMLSFSRRSGSRRDMQDLAELLERTVELAAHDYDLRKKYDFRHIEIVREYQEGMPKVPCMATEIEQVMLNLLKNAAQAMAEKVSGGMHPRITLRLRCDGDTARIEVEDNGPGMDEKHRKRVFEPFFTTKEVGTGTGLGLSVSYFIVTSNHKGSMTVESEPGRGARFIIELPLE